ncbi:MAG: extracellular catalytic domain type 1 short-chain-length polyhydroxyalkanoate depolymerase [Gemmatimonadaceae bacterium]
MTSGARVALLLAPVTLHAQAGRPPAAADSLRTPAVSVRTAGGWVDGTFTNATGSRRYRLYVPEGNAPTGGRMLVVLLHGCTQDAGDFARGTRVARHADRDGFLALLPEQPVTAHPKKCWNWYEPAHQARDAGEPSLIADLTRHIAREYGADSARVHLAGISAGAAMASLVAVAYPELYASLALHSGLPWRAATGVASALGAMGKGVPDADALGSAAFEAMPDGARAIPALVIHGAKDAVASPLNSRQSARQWAVTNARALGAPPPAASGPAGRETSGETAGYRWTRTCHLSAVDRCVVEELVVHELGHAWSGGSREGTYTDERGPEAMSEIVRFFRENPMPGRR